MKPANTFSITKTAELFVPDTISRTGYLVATGITFLLTVLLLLVLPRLPHVVPLFFTEPWGEARLASRQWLFLFPVLSFTTLVLNVLLGKLGGTSSSLLPRILAVTSGVVALTLLLSLLGIVQSLTL